MSTLNQLNFSLMIHVLKVLGRIFVAAIPGFRQKSLSLRRNQLFDSFDI